MFFLLDQGIIGIISVQIHGEQVCRQIKACDTMPLTAEKQRQARAQAAVAEGRTDFKHRAPRKRTLEEMQSRTEDAEVRARRLAELLEQAASEAEHQKRLVALWRARAH